MSTEGYSGWKNRQTWNVALWVSNDEGLYHTAVDYVKMRKGKGKKATWRGFVDFAGLAGDRTPDGIAWDGSRLDLVALREMLEEMVS